MIRILHTIDTTGPGGAETVFVNLIKGLDSGKFESVVAIRGQGWVCDSLRRIGVEPIFLESKGSFNIRYLAKLIKTIRERRIDVIQSHLFGSSLYCSLAGLICNVPVVSTIHGFVDVQKNERLMWLKSVFINLGSKNVTFVSDNLRDYFVKNFGFLEKKSVTIYNGVDTSVFYPKKNYSFSNKLGFNSNNIIVGAVGNIRHAKGYDTFIKAAKIISDKCPECRFIVAGQGSGILYDDLLKMRQDLCLEKTLFFVGFQSEVSSVYNNLDIYVLPSKSEGFSISTIEAMACGLPVVVTKCGGPEEIVTHQYNGIIVDSCNSQSLANGVMKLIQEKNLRSKLGKNAYEHIINIFSNKTMVKKYENLYTIL